MTTFTMQDLTPTDTPTPEEEEAMDMLVKAQEQTAKDIEVIQGATGAQYTPMDTSPQAQQNQQAIEQLLNNLTYTIQAIIKLSVEKYKQPVSGGEGLHECVDTVLAEADWLMEKLEDAMDSRYAMTDLIAQGVDDGVRDAVENWFSNDFSLEDHVDIYSMVDTAVEDKLDDVVEDKLADVVEEKLNELMQGKNITISFN